MIYIRTTSGRQFSAPLYVPPTHRVQTDYEIHRQDRVRLPMVFVFDNNHVRFTKEWQYFLRGVNMGMAVAAVGNLMLDGRAFFNGTGTGGKAQRRNWLTAENLDAKDPETDKTRTCGDATLIMSGTTVVMFDGTKPPPLKPGFTQPKTLEEVSMDIYLYNPRTHPTMFCAAVSTGPDYKPRPFPNGALYWWYKGGTTPVSFFPHVGLLPVTWPPSTWTDNTPHIVHI